MTKQYAHTTRAPGLSLPTSNEVADKQADRDRDRGCTVTCTSYETRIYNDPKSTSLCTHWFSLLCVIWYQFPRIRLMLVFPEILFLITQYSRQDIVCQSVAFSATHCNCKQRILQPLLVTVKQMSTWLKSKLLHLEFCANGQSNLLLSSGYDRDIPCGIPLEEHWNLKYCNRSVSISLKILM